MDLILFYDTETTGIPKWNLPSHDASQPHITQLAAELCDERSGNVIAFMEVLIRPAGWVIPHELEELTGITTERAFAEGVPIADALGRFIPMWRRAALRCGHNESFDARMVRIETMREVDRDDPFHEDWKKAPVFCTQGRSAKILNEFRDRGMKKTPNLAEAYKHFVGEELSGAHDAAVDLRAAKAVYYGIREHLARAAA
jgi:Exonuclease.